MVEAMKIIGMTGLYAMHRNAQGKVTRHELAFDKRDFEFAFPEDQKPGGRIAIYAIRKGTAPDLKLVAYDLEGLKAGQFLKVRLDVS